jgi:hypothetical protein
VSVGSRVKGSNYAESLAARTVEIVPLEFKYHGCHKSLIDRVGVDIWGISNL